VDETFSKRRMKPGVEPAGAAAGDRVHPENEGRATTTRAGGAAAVRSGLTSTATADFTTPALPRPRAAHREIAGGNLSLGSSVGIGYSSFVSLRIRFSYSLKILYAVFSHRLQPNSILSCRNTLQNESVALRSRVNCDSSLI